MQRRFAFVAAGLILLLVAGTVALERSVTSGSEPVYPIGVIEAGLNSQPQEWVGRIVRVRGVALFSVWTATRTSWAEYPCALSGWATCPLSSPLSMQARAGHLGIADAPFPGLAPGVSFDRYWMRIQRQHRAMALRLQAPSSPPSALSDALRTAVRHLPLIGPMISVPATPLAQVEADAAMMYRVRLLSPRPSQCLGNPPPCDDAMLLDASP